MNNFHESLFEVNLNHLEKNLSFLTRNLNSNTKIISVVKAFAYGHGDISICKKLEKLNIYAFWVADFEEGVILRKNGIEKPIIVANTSPKSISQIIKYNLDVVVYNFRMLDALISKKEPITIHLKFNCGMNRFGFSENDIPKIKKDLNNNKMIVRSICSHLSCSRMPDKDNITNNELRKFNNIVSKFPENILAHVLNTSGVIRFPQHQYSAIRLGIGLYGIHDEEKLVQIGKLTTTISQVRSLKKNEIIGYGGRFQTTKKMKTGVVPFGYADGLDRRLGNSNGSLFVNGKECKILGEISMDSCVIDLTETLAREGDRVEIFGLNNNINSICEKINSIPYEFLSKINRRIKRVYIN